MNGRGSGQHCDRSTLSFFNSQNRNIFGVNLGLIAQTCGLYQHVLTQRLQFELTTNTKFFGDNMVTTLIFRQFGGSDVVFLWRNS